MSEETKQEVFDVLSRYSLCVLATVNQQVTPEAAIVGFSTNKNLEILFGTSAKTRKYANLQQHANVAITIGDFKAEVQYEGVAEQLELAQAEERFGTTPGIEKYRTDPDQTWWLVNPVWLRLTVHETPNRIVEMRQFS